MPVVLDLALSDDPASVFLDTIWRLVTNQAATLDSSLLTEFFTSDLIAPRLLRQPAVLAGLITKNPACFDCLNDFPDDHLVWQQFPIAKIPSSLWGNLSSVFWDKIVRVQLLQDKLGYRTFMMKMDPHLHLMPSCLCIHPLFQGWTEAKIHPNAKAAGVRFFEAIPQSVSETVRFQMFHQLAISWIHLCPKQRYPNLKENFQKYHDSLDSTGKATLSQMKDELKKLPTINFIATKGMKLECTIKDPDWLAVFYSYLVADNSATSEESYKSLDLMGRLIFRALLYVAMLNSSPKIQATLDVMCQSFVNHFRANDMTDAELYFLARVAIQKDMAFILVDIVRKYPNHPESKTLYRHVRNMQLEPHIFHLTASQKLSFFSRKPYNAHLLPTDTCSLLDVEKKIRALKHEQLEAANNDADDDSQKCKKMRTTDSSETVLSSASCSSSIGDYFIGNEQIEEFLTRAVPMSKFESEYRRDVYPMFEDETEDEYRARSVFRLPHLDNDILSQRLEHFNQNLKEEDGGEAAWHNNYQTEPYVKFERDLSLFVCGMFAVLGWLGIKASHTATVEYMGSSSVGPSMLDDAISKMAEIIFLPSVKLFRHNPHGQGFTPYPLLHPAFLGLIAVLHAQLIQRDLEFEWNLDRWYLQFLYYDTDFTVSIDDYVRNIYPRDFRNLRDLADVESISDYYPLNFAYHVPYELDFPYSLNEQRFTFDSPAFDKQRQAMRQFEYCSAYDSSLELGGMDAAQYERRLLATIKTNLMVGRLSYRRNFILHIDPMYLRHITAALMQEYNSEVLASKMSLDRLWACIKFDICANQGAQALAAENLKILDGFDKETDAPLTLTPAAAFRKILESFSSEDLQRFYHFATATRRLPSDPDKAPVIGISVWEPEEPIKLVPQIIREQPACSNSELKAAIQECLSKFNAGLLKGIHWPRVHTCFNSVKWVLYPEFEDNLNAFLRSINYSTCFTIDEEVPIEE